MKEIEFENELRASKAYAALLQDIARGLGHAYLIVCPDDETAAEFFSLAGATILCVTGTACLECAECRRVLHGNHADVQEINSAGGKIKVQEVKELTASASIRSLSGKKLYFVHRADLMTPDAQNKLLKTLEEPPEGVTIFLGAANESGLLETVKSRCRRIYMDVFEDSTVCDAMLRLGCSAESAAIAAACAEGKLGSAKEIALSPEYAEIYSEAVDLLMGLKRSSDVLRLDNTHWAAKDTQAFLSVLLVVLKDVLSVRVGLRTPFQGDMKNKLESIAEEFPELALARIITAVNDTAKKLSLNVNPLAAYDALLFRILEVKFTCR